MINLKKNEGVNLSKNFGHVSRFKIELDWDVNPAAVRSSDRFELNVGGFLLTHATGKPMCMRDEDFIFYGNRSDPTGSVLHNPDDWKGGTDIMFYDQDKLSAKTDTVDELSVIAEIYEASERGQDFGHVNHARVTISDADTGVAIANFKLTEDDGDSTAVQMGSFVRKGNDWHFEAVGKGYRKGWASFVTAYGLQVGSDE
jgi:tellurium resistance protein TerD